MRALPVGLLPLHLQLVLLVDQELTRRLARPFPAAIASTFVRCTLVARPPRPGPSAHRRRGATLRRSSARPSSAAPTLGLQAHLAYNTPGCFAQLARGLIQRLCGVAPPLLAHRRPYLPRTGGCLPTL